MSMDERGGIGISNRLPWHIPSDLVRFKQLTQGTTVVMGSKTFFSLPINKRPLPGGNRTSIVLTRDPSDFKFDSYRNHPNLHIITLDQFSYDDNMIIIGGAEVFDLFFNYINVFHLSVIKSTYECDCFLNVRWDDWIVSEFQEYTDHTYYVLLKNTENFTNFERMVFLEKKH